MKKVIEFYSQSCSPCKMVKTILTSMEQKFPEVIFEYVDVHGEMDEFQQKIFEKLNVRNVPKIVLTNENGDLIKELNGMQTFDNLKKFVEQ